MLSRVLLVYVLRIAAVVLGAVALVANFVFGPDAALGVMVGGGLIVLDGVALVYLVGQLLDPALAGSLKGFFAAVLVAKFTIVAGLLWASLAIWNVNGLGLLVGLGIGLMALVLGLHRGSTSPEGLAAMQKQADRIDQEMGDNDDELG